LPIVFPAIGDPVGAPRPLRLLRARRERPRRGSAANQVDELAPPHESPS
jgi:hypothetical protein